MNISLKGKKAVVCGSTQGIGKAVAIELATLGAEVTLIARNECKLKMVKQELDTQAGQQHSHIAIDFENPEILKTKINEFVDTISEVHILINNTGGPPAGWAVEATPEEYQKAFVQHVICNQLLTQALVPLMKKAGYGRIVNIIATSVKQPMLELGVSNTIRGAVANWAKTLSLELACYGITVNNVLPGATKTTRLEAFTAYKANTMSKSMQQIEEEMIAQIPAKRFAEAEEVAAAAAFLCTPAAAYINGINVPVDGGRTTSL